MAKKPLFWVECPCETCNYVLAGAWVLLEDKAANVRAAIRALEDDVRDAGGEVYDGMFFCSPTCKALALQPVALDD